MHHPSFKFFFNLLVPPQLQARIIYVALEYTSKSRDPCHFMVCFFWGRKNLKIISNIAPCLFSFLESWNRQIAIQIARFTRRPGVLQNHEYPREKTIGVIWTDFHCQGQIWFAVFNISACLMKTTKISSQIRGYGVNLRGKMFISGLASTFWAH